MLVYQRVVEKKNTQKSRLWYGVNLRAMILRNN